ncbi:MAG TPA: hypothetical protein VGQ21_00390 [Thermoanaerobaculia bacterium]|nr:hypothetical protein [Thermoanaerobaculia bacterium]
MSSRTKSGAFAPTAAAVAETGICLLPMKTAKQKNAATAMPKMDTIHASGRWRRALRSPTTSRTIAIANRISVGSGTSRVAGKRIKNAK